MSKNPVVILTCPQSFQARTIQTKHIAEVYLNPEHKQRVQLFPTHMPFDALVSEVYRWEYETDDQAENVYKSISQAMVKGCSVKIDAYGDAMFKGKGS